MRPYTQHKMGACGRRSLVIPIFISHNLFSGNLTTEENPSKDDSIKIHEKPVQGILSCIFCSGIPQRCRLDGLIENGFVLRATTPASMSYRGHNLISNHSELKIIPNQSRRRKCHRIPSPASP